jgi:hypothetical protein
MAGRPRVLSRTWPTMSFQPTRRDLLVAGLSVLAIVPLWVPFHPPMTDIPQHAAQVALLRNLQDPSFGFAGLFRVVWFTPYLVGYALVYALTPFLGIVSACKLVVSLALLAIPLSTALVLGEVGSSKHWALLTVPALYGFSYQWGFLNYLVAAPLGMLLLWLTMRHVHRPSARRCVWLAVLANLLFFCHALVCAFFLAIAGCYIYFELERNRFLVTLQRAAPLLTVLGVASIWTLGSLASPVAQSVRWDLGWFDTNDVYYGRLAIWANSMSPGWGRLTGFFPRLFGLLPGPICTLWGVLVFSLPLVAGQKFSRRMTRWIPFVLCAVALLLVPSYCFGTAFVYQRLTVFALPFYLLALTDAPRARSTSPVPVALLAVVSIAVNLWQTTRYEAQARGFDEVLRTMEPGERALSLVFDRDADGWIAPLFLHYPSWYSAEKAGIVDPSFADFGLVVLYRPEARPKATVADGFEWKPWTFQWQAFDASRYRYVVVHASTDLAQLLSRGAPCPVRLLVERNRWWLYETNKMCAP